MILVLLATAGFALGAEPATATPALEARESWYLGFSLGYPALAYSGETGRYARSLRADASVSRVPLAAELGVYWPLSIRHETLLGVAAHGTVDHYAVGGDSVDIARQLVAGSAIAYLGPRLARGFFLRGDLGLAVSSLSDSSGFSREGGPGPGGFAGFGWALPVSEETRLVVQAGYSLSWIEGEAYHQGSVGVGALF